MRSIVRVLVLALGALLFPVAAVAQTDPDSAASAPPGPSRLPATMQIERQGNENPFIEVSKTTMWGALAGTVIGGAISLANNGKDNGEATRWSIVIGTFAGLGFGIAHVTRRPQPRALIEWYDGRAQANVALLTAVETSGGWRVRAVALRF